MPRKKATVPTPLAVPFHPSQSTSEAPSPFPSVLAPPDAANGSASPLPNGSVVVEDSQSASGSITKTLGGYIPPHIAKQMETEGIDQFELPRAVVTRVAKTQLPDNVQIRKEAILAISKSATIFISYLAAVSDELAKQNARKAVALSDVLEGLGLMEFPEDFRAEVKTSLKAFRRLEADKRAAAGNRGAGGAGAGAGAGATSAADASTVDAGEEDEDDAIDDDDQQDESMRQGASSATTGEEQPIARPAQEDKDVDEEDEDTEQRMVDEGAQEADDQDEDEDMGS